MERGRQVGVNLPANAAQCMRAPIGPDLWLKLVCANARNPACWKGFAMHNANAIRAAYLILPLVLFVSYSCRMHSHKRHLDKQSGELESCRECFWFSSGQDAGNIARFSMPKKDLHVTLDGVELKPALALGSFMHFGPMMTQLNLLRGCAPPRKDPR